MTGAHARQTLGTRSTRKWQLLHTHAHKILTRIGNRLAMGPHAPSHSLAQASLLGASQLASLEPLSFSALPGLPLLEQRGKLARLFPLVCLAPEFERYDLVQLE